MSVPAAVYRIENLQRAWRWIRSNADAGYKNYFRDHYSAYSTAQDALLRDLSDRLRRGAYAPAHACKIYLPKPSGVLRPYTLLDVEDQIVYQAAANVVAERMHARVRHRYFAQVFGHLYAGSSSTWFYRKWSKGYSAFNKAAVDAHGSGNVYAASFDLTAFYDSIDHRVLSHFLEEFGVDRDLVHNLREWLTVWTSTDAQILQGHGIPQGPLSSGLIAESVLAHLDNHGWTKARVIYLRYVDDIRLFAKTEFLLRRALIRLDRLSKDIGLFPQSSKIGIHHVTDIRDELKSVSQPGERAVEMQEIDQQKVFRQLVELSPRYFVQDKTRFKYALAQAKPHSRLTERLWHILDRAPEFYESVARYLARANKLPRKTSREVVRRISRENLYPAVAAAFLRATVGSLHPAEKSRAKTVLKKLWAPKSRSPEFTVALGQWLLAEGALTPRQIGYACSLPRPSWVRSSLLLAADASISNPETRDALVKLAVVDNCIDASVCGAVIAGKDGKKPEVGVRQLRRHAALVLKEFGLVRRAGGRICGINASFSSILDKVVSLNWKSFFGKRYRQAERQIVGCRGYASTDATAWVQGLDVFNDLLLDALCRNDSTLGGYQLGNIGGCTGSPSLVLKTRFPHVLELACEIHHTRYQSYLAHPKVKNTQKATSRIPFSFIRESKRLLARAIAEIEASRIV